MKQLSLIGILFILATGLRAQGYSIKINLPDAPNEKISLAHYYLSKLYIDDTTHVDDKGVGEFKGDSLLHQGLYKIYLNSKKHFDFLLAEDQDFVITNPDFSVENIKIEGARQSQEFADYMKFLNSLQKKRRDLAEKMKTATGEDKAAYRKELEGLTGQLHDYWLKTDEKYPNTLLSKFLLANYVPTPDLDSIPENIRQNDSLLLRYRFDFQKQHYFDYFDLLDERMLYSPLTKPKIESYFTQILLQTFDSVYAGSLELIEKVRPNKPMFQYVTSYILNSSINSKIMGMDALFVELAKKYYLSGEAFWADSTTIEKIKENVLFAEKNLIGLTAPELKLEGINGEEYFSLHQVDAKRTLLLIYEPNCSHCKIFVPKLHEQVYRKFKDKGFEVYAIYSMDNKKEWVDFVEKNNLYDWINVWDEHDLSRFKITYDARKTPGVYLLDENKKIIYKKLGVDQIEKILEEDLGGG